MSKNTVWTRFVKQIAGTSQVSTRPRLAFLPLEDRVVPTVQFAVPSETIAATAGTFSITVTDTNPPTGGTPTVTTFATGFMGVSGADFDAAGNLYVGSQPNQNSVNVISKVTPAGVVSTFVNGISGQTGGLVVDSAGNVYVSRFGTIGVPNTSLVEKVSPGGVRSTFATGFNEADGLTVDAAGNVFVVDGPNNVINKVTPAGVVSTFASGLNSPFGVTIDAAGNLFVANIGNGTISKVTPAGVVSTYASGVPFNTDLDVDAAGNLYVASAFNNGIAKVTPAGVVSTYATLASPYGVAVQGSDVYVSNNGNMVSKVSPGTTTVTVPFTLGGTAVAGTDYTLSTTSPVTFTGGATSRTIIGTLTPAAAGTPNKTLTFTLGTPTGDTLGSPATNTLTIAEPAAAGATVQFTTGSETVNASAGMFSIPVTLTGTPTGGTPTVSTFASGLNVPHAEAFDAAGNLYVSNDGVSPRTISKISPAGVVTTFASGFSIVTGLAFDTAGNLYAAENGNDRVSKITPAGVVSTFATGISRPGGLAIDAAGNLYVSIGGNGASSGTTVSKITPAGVVTTFASGFTGPSGLAFDAAGNLYVANQTDGGSGSGTTVSKVTPAGTVTTFASGLNDPFSLAFDAAGNLFETEFGTNTVNKITPAGVVSVYSTAFTNVRGVAFDAAGNLYVSNAGTNLNNGSISKVTPGGSATVTVPFTLGGTAVQGTDYTLTSTSPLTFAPGTTTVNVTGTLTPNGTGSKTLTVTLGTPTGGGATAGTPATNTLTIVEPGAAATVQFTTGSETVNASTGAFSIPVTLTGTPTGGGTPTQSTFASGFGTVFGKPAFDAAGNLYVADTNSGVVRKVTPAGVVSTYASGFNQPFGLTFDGAGNLFVADYNSGTVKKVTPAGVVSTYASGFGGPQALVFDAAGNLYVDDYPQTAAGGGTTKVSKVTPAGVVSTVTSGFPDSHGLTIDAAGNLYLAEGNGTVQKVTPAGVASTFASGFSYAYDDAFDAAGNLYVADYNAGTVSKVTPAGAVSTYATFAANTRLSGLAFDAAGNLFVTDLDSGTVRKLTPGAATVTVPFTLGGTAVAGTDYTLTSTSPLTFGPGVTTVNVTGTLISRPGANKTLTVTLGTPTGGGATLGGTPTNTLTVAEPAPTLGSITPTSAAAGSPATTVTLTGTNFAADTVVTVNGTAVATTFVSPTQLTAVIPAASLAAPGNLSIAAQNANGTTSAPQTFTVVSATAPTIATVSPTTAPAGSPATTITLAGTGFTAASVVSFNGSPIATTFVSPTQLTAVIPAASLATGGNDPVTVTDAGGTSAPVTFAVTNPAPTLGSVTPNSAPAGSPATTVTLTGTNFVAGSVVTLNGSPIATTFVSPTQLTAVIPAGSLTTAGPLSLTVATGGPGGGTSAPVTFTVGAGVAITSGTPPAPTTGQPYSFTVTATGGAAPLTFAVSAGTLPAGLALNPATGAITGTPTTAGPVSFTLQAKDANGQTATQPVTLTVSNPLGVSTTAIAAPSNGVPYSQPIATTGGRGPTTFAVTSGALPAGLTLDPATGTVSGTPTANAPFSFAVTATDADGRTAVSPTFSGTVTAPLAVTTATIPPVTNGVPYSQPIATTGGQGPDTFAVTAGSLPTGLSIDPATGTISGTPTANGPFSFAVTATDAAGRTAASPTFAGTVTAPLAVTTTAVAAPSTGVPYSQPIATTGGNGPTTFAISSGALPAGLTLDPATGTISGTPTGNAPFSFAVTATDADGRTAASPTFTGTVAAPLAVTTAGIAPVSSGVPYSQAITTTGGQSPDTFAVTAGALPAGLTLDPATGTVSGTPTANGPFSFAVTATDAAGRTAASPTFSGTVTAPLVVTTTTIAPISKGVPYSLGVDTTGGASPVSFALTPGSTLPAGLALDPATGTVSGTPTTNGTFGFGVTATDAAGRTARTPTFVATVTDPLAVTTATLPTPTKGQPYSQAVRTTGGQTPVTFAATGTLPAGLSLDPATGVISGTPTTDGPSAFTITATDAAGRTAAQTFSETVSDPLAISTTGVPAPTAGQAYNAPIATTGGRGPTTFAVTAGSLPAGLTLDPATGTVSGTPTATAPFNFTVTATDADGRQASRPFSGGVSSPLAVTTTAVAPMSKGVPYSQPVTTTGGRGPTTFAVTSGALPAGLAIDPATGTISGTPTADGSSPFAVTATDADGRTAASPTFGGTVTDPLVVTPATLAPTRGQAVSQPVQTTGGAAPVTFAVTAGTLPAGVALDPATGALSGTPTAAGPFAFTVTATDAAGRAGSQSFAGQVSDPLAVSTTALPAPTRGAAYSAAVATTGGRGPTTFAVNSGALPAGLTLNPATGVISGTPTATGFSAFAVTATDADGRTASKGLTLSTSDPVTFPAGSGRLADGTAGARYTQSVAATGGAAPLTYAVTAGALPAGLTLDPATGAVTGNPTAAGTFTFTVTATDATGVKGSQAETIVVANPLSVGGTGTLGNGIVQRAYSQSVGTAGGTAPVTFALTAGALPAGLALKSDGTVAGTPTAAGTFNFTVTATDAAGRTSSRSESLTLDAGSNLSRIFAAGAGDGGGARVRVFDRATGAGMADFFAFEPSFRGGANVAVGDVNGDGVPDVVIAAGNGGGARIIVVDGTKLNQLDADGRIASSAQLANFFAFDTSFRGGATVALARLDGGAGLDIVVGAGAGGGPRVRTFSLTPGVSGGVTQLPGAIGSFFAFDPSSRFGVTVAAGNLDGTGVDSVIVGQGLGGPPQVAVFRADGSVREAFTASNLAPTGGVSVAAGYLDGTNSAQLVLGTGPGGPPLVNVYSGTDTTPERTLTAFESSFTGGVSVNSGPVGQQSDIFLGAGSGGGPRVRVLTPDGVKELYNFFPYETTFHGGVNVG